MKMKYPIYFVITIIALIITIILLSYLDNFTEEWAKGFYSDYAIEECTTNCDFLGLKYYNLEIPRYSKKVYCNCLTKEGITRIIGEIQ